MSPRHLEIVPDSDDDIVEEVHYLRKTKQGTKAVKKQTRKTRPPQPKAGEASRSWTKGQRQADTTRVEDPQLDVDEVGDMDTYQFIDGYEDNVPELVAEEIQPQVVVRSHIICHSGAANSVYIDNYGPMVGLPSNIPEYFTGDGRSGLCSDMFNMLQQT